MLSKTPTTASSSTMGSSASTTYVHQKFIWQMCIYYFSKINQFKMVHRWSWRSQTPQRPRQAQLWRIQQVPVMFIKNWHDTRLYAIFERQIDLKPSQRDTGWSIKMLLDTLSDLVNFNHAWGVQQVPAMFTKLTCHKLISFSSKTNPFKVDPGGSKYSCHPHKPCQAQPWRVQQVSVLFIKIWHGTCLYTIFERQIDLKRSQRVTGWSRCSLTDKLKNSLKKIYVLISPPVPARSGQKYFSSLIHFIPVRPPSPPRCADGGHLK